MSETTSKIEASGMKWEVVVTKWDDGVYTVHAETKDQMPYHHYVYDPLWEGEHHPTSEEITEMLDEQVEHDSESAWESVVHNYYSA